MEVRSVLEVPNQRESFLVISPDSPKQLAKSQKMGAVGNNAEGTVGTFAARGVGRTDIKQRHRKMTPGQTDSVLGIMHGLTKRVPRNASLI